MCYPCLGKRLYACTERHKFSWGEVLFNTMRETITFTIPSIDFIVDMLLFVFSLKDVEKVLLLVSDATLDLTNNPIPTSHPDPLRGERYLQAPVLLHSLLSPVAPHGLTEGADHGDCQGEGRLSNTWEQSGLVTLSYYNGNIYLPLLE